MTDITTADITNKTETSDGTGVFDVLMQSSSVYLNAQFMEGRITGAEFATVYLGAMQTVLQQAITFILSEQEASNKADLIAAQTAEILAGTIRADAESTAKIELINIQVTEVTEKIDAIIAQTAQYYEAIKSSQDKTIRDNLLNNSTVTKLKEETDLLISKDLEEIAGTVRKDAESEVKIVDLNHSISIKAQQEFNLQEKNGNIITTYTYYVDGISGATTTTVDLNNVLGPILSTAITDGAGISVTSLDKEILKSKDLLIEAQTLGFASDTKQKILKQMHDAFAVVLSIAGTGNIPEAIQDAAIDQVTQELLNDVGSSVIVQSTAQVPDTGGTAPSTPDIP